RAGRGGRRRPRAPPRGGGGPGAAADGATEFDDGALKQRLDDLLTDCTGTVPPKLKTLHDALDELPDSKSSNTSEPSSWPPAHCRPATSRRSASNGT
ncbi:hypothetical protein, partial [Kitasatospora cineracea]|uniref:hypothetical protein n=1 Tax=Kitasatospora cineracea TaxID=88074 RepID=UPI0033FA5C4A